MKIKHFGSFAVAALMLVGSASTASASELRLLVERVGGGGYARLFAQDQILNDDESSLDIVTLNNTVLQAAFPELANASTVTASTNRAIADEDFGNLVLDTVFSIRAGYGASYTYRVTAAVDNFIRPLEENRFGTSTATVNFSDASNLNSTQYQGYIDVDNGMAIDGTGNFVGFGAHSPGLLGPWSSAGFFNNSNSGFNGPIFFTDTANYSLGAQIQTTVRRNAVVDAGGIISVIGDEAVVPEPTSMFLFGTGLIGLVAVARRRRK